MQTARRSAVEGFFNEQAQRCRTLIAGYELLERQQAKAPAQQTDINVLVIGPRTSGKSSLIRTLQCALNNRLESASVEPLVRHSAIISKTELHPRKKYIIDGRSNLYQAHRSINLLEFREEIEMNTLSKFSSVFGVIDETSLALCGYQLFSSRIRANVQAIVVCLRAGQKLGKEEGRCLMYLLQDITDKGLKPLITLTHTEEFTNGLTQQQSLERIEMEILRVESELAQPRQNIFPIQLYTSSSAAKTVLNEQINYYALTLLAAAVKNAIEYLRYQREIKSRSFWLCGCKW